MIQNLIEKSPKRLWAIIAVVVIGIDQITKIWAQSTLRGEGRNEYLGGLFVLEYAENPGAFLSFGSNLPDGMRFMLFVVLVAVFLIYIAYHLFTKPLHPMVAAAYALLLGGGISNLIDRAFREQGRVIDFLNMGIGSLRTGIFNIADFAIVIALVLVLLELVQNRSTSGEESVAK